MSESTIWWVLAGMMVAIELLTGTFYLIMVAIGFVAAAVAAHAGAAPALQLVVAAVFGGGSVIVWHYYKRSAPPEPSANANGNVNMDVGEHIQVDDWGPDLSSSVKYRGAMWTVVLRAGDVATPGRHRIVEVVGSRLIVTKS